MIKTKLFRNGVYDAGKCNDALMRPGAFLYGMKLMGDGLELAAGSKLKNLVERLTTNKYMGGADWAIGDGGHSELFGNHRHGGRFCQCRHYAAWTGRQGLLWARISARR